MLSGRAVQKTVRGGRNRAQRDSLTECRQESLPRTFGHRHDMPCKEASLAPGMTRIGGTT